MYEREIAECRKQIAEYEEYLEKARENHIEYKDKKSKLFNKITTGLTIFLISTQMLCMFYLKPYYRETGMFLAVVLFFWSYSNVHELKNVGPSYYGIDYY